MSIGGSKDTDREILKHVDDKELLKFCAVNRKTWNDVCDDNFLKRRLSKYPGIEKYKREKETWKQFYLNVVYYIAKLEESNFRYTKGDFRKQYKILRDSHYGELLFQAARAGDESLVKYALDNKFSEDINGALKIAANGGHLDVVKYLVERGANIHLQSEFPLTLALINGHAEVVKYLVSKGADVHIHDNYLLKLARERGQKDIMNYLLVGEKKL